MPCSQLCWQRVWGTGSSAKLKLLGLEEVEGTASEEGPVPKKMSQVSRLRGRYEARVVKA